MNTAQCQWLKSDDNERWSFVNSGSSEVSTLRKEYGSESSNTFGLNVISFPLSYRIDKKTVLIPDLGDERLSLQNLLPVTVEYIDKQVTVYSHDLGEFAFAIDEIDAVDEFKASIVDLYFLLKEEQNNLGPLPLKHWNFLKSIIHEN